MDIAFKAGEQDHKVKITAYTTTCSMTVQPIGEPPEAREHLGKRFSMISHNRHLIHMKFIFILSFIST